MQYMVVIGESLTAYKDTGVSCYRDLGSAGFSCVRNDRSRCRAIVIPGLSRILFSMACCAILFGVIGCGLIRKRSEDSPSGLDIVGKPMTSRQAKEVLGTVGGNFAYGSGLGDAALNVGAVVLFPPYVLYLLGNAALSVSGYQPITVSSLLPEEDGKQWAETYDKMVSGPGRVVAAMTGHEYRSQEVADERLRAVFSNIQEAGVDQPALTK